MLRHRLFFRTATLAAIFNLLMCISRDVRADSLEAQSTLGDATKARALLVVKHLRTLYLLHRGEVIARYPVQLGRHPQGPKTKAHDGRTPEGHYIIDWRDPLSLYTLAFHISYPNDHDREQARALGVDPGGAIEIHGQPFVDGAYSAQQLQSDWTAGCIALSAGDMENLWEKVDVGTPVEIKP